MTIADKRKKAYELGYEAGSRSMFEPQFDELVSLVDDVSCVHERKSIFQSYKDGVCKKQGQLQLAAYKIALSNPKPPCNVDYSPCCAEHEAAG